jgi:hypothetical protein
VSPADAIADMLAPVVLISAGGIFANRLLGADTANGNRLHELNSERLSIVGGPRGERLTEDRVPDMDRARLRLIDHQVPLVMDRIRGIRNACVLVYIAMGVLVVSVILIAASIPDSSRALGYTALALVVCGVTIHFAAIVLVTRVMIDGLASESPGRVHGPCRAARAARARTRI